MGLLQNGFRDAIGVFKFHGGGVLNGAIPQELVGNWHLTGPMRNITAGQGIPSEQVGVPLGYGQGAAWIMPQKRGQMSARMYDIRITGAASGTMGFPIVGSASFGLTATGTLLPEDDTSPLRTGSASFELTATGTLLPEDDTSPLRTASATFGLTATGEGELKSSGVGAATFGLTATAEAIGIFWAEGASSISITTNAPTLGAEASLTGEAAIALVSSGWLLPLDDDDPARTASATISMTGSLTPYAKGHMVGSTVSSTDLSPQAVAQAVWSYEQ